MTKDLAAIFDSMLSLNKSIYNRAIIGNNEAKQGL